MKPLRHLSIEEIKLPAGQEWKDTGAAWRFVRLHSGAAYWLGEKANRQLSEGETILIAPATKGVVRASQIGDAVLHGFAFAPDALWGFFTLAQRYFFEALAARDTGEVRSFPATHPLAQRFARIVAEGLHPALSQRVQALAVAAEAFDEELRRYRMPAEK